MLTETTIKNMLRKVGRCPIKAFTLLDSLLTLSLTIFILLLFTAGVREVYQSIEKSLFYIRFEHYYTESQTLAWARQEASQLIFEEDRIKGPDGELVLPAGIRNRSLFQLDLTAKGNHTGLSRIVFEDLESGARVHYQARIGNGILQRSEE